MATLGLGPWCSFLRIDLLKGLEDLYLSMNLFLNQIKNQPWNLDLFFQGDLNVDDLYSGIPLDVERLCSVLLSAPTAPSVAPYFAHPCTI